MSDIPSSAKCMWMRGGTSKGAYFLAEDLPKDLDLRDEFLLRIMGSPDPEQIDGIGGADSLKSKVAIVQKSSREGVDVDYLFLQVSVDEAKVSSIQNCGNILAGVGAFSIERGLVEMTKDVTKIAIFMENTKKIAVQRIVTPNKVLSYAGDAVIDGVPGSAQAIPIEFEDIAGSTCGALLPTGNIVDSIDGINVTCIDNGMPVVVLAAKDFGLSGYETRENLMADKSLNERIRELRIKAGKLMNLGDVTNKTVPKITFVSKANNGGCISTRTHTSASFHASIGVLGAVSVATACMLPGSPANDVAEVPEGSDKILNIEHAIGQAVIIMGMNGNEVENVAVLRTTRKLFDGEVFA